MEHSDIGDGDTPRSLEEPLLQQPTSSASDDGAHRAHEDAESTSLPGMCDGLLLETSILIKTLYFLDALSSSTWGRYSAIYYNIHALNSQQIGLIEGLRSAIPTGSMMLWGVVADRWRRRKEVWLGTKTASTSILLLLAIPYIYRSYFRILIVSILAQLFVSDGILDAYTLDLLGRENKMFYGRYRLFASLSWGIGSIIFGWVNDHYSFDWNFLLLGILSICMILLVAKFIPETSSDPPNNVLHDATSEVTPDQGKLSDLLKLAVRPKVLVFLFQVTVMGAAMATVERLLFLYLVNDLGASTLLCGLSVGVNVLFELPIFWYANPIMNALGHDGLFIMAQTCFVLRVYGYTFLSPSTKHWILALEILHGITFACFWTVTTDISKVLIHQTDGAFWSTAIPSAVQMLYSAVGVSLGSILGGWAMHVYGSKEMYSIAARIVLCMLVIQITGSFVCRTCCAEKSFLPANGSPNPSSDDTEDPGHGDEDFVPAEGSLFDRVENEDHCCISRRTTITDIIQSGSLLVTD
jgi:MFS family permease